MSSCVCVSLCLSVVHSSAVRWNTRDADCCLPRLMILSMLLSTLRESMSSTGMTLSVLLHFISISLLLMVQCLCRNRVSAEVLAYGTELVVKFCYCG